MFYENQRIGEYTLVRKLGRGGFGEVWLAENGGQSFALKLPHRDQIDWKQITQEIGLWTLCGKHPNVMSLVGARNFNGQIAIISEYAPDGSLEDLLRAKGKLSITEAIEMIIGILKGLQHLHDSGIIHRDLKPANILLDGKTPRLTDFGISRIITSDSSSQLIAGTWAYMAPECFDGKRNIQTDIWSVGVILYRMLTGNLPFPQKEQTELIGAIIMREPQFLESEFSERLKRILVKTLNKVPKERFQGTEDLLQNLKRFRDIEDTLTRAHVDDVIENMRSAVSTNKEFVEVNEYAQECLRRIFAEIHYQKFGEETEVKSFEGVFLEPEEVESVTNMIHKLIKDLLLETDYEKDNLYWFYELLNNMNESAKAFRNTLAIYEHKEAIPRLKAERTKYFENMAKIEIIRIAAMKIPEEEKNALMRKVQISYGKIMPSQQ
ncbi:MAG: serine/threonine protein kinase [Acidobacteriota bacterium]|nr:serine/threonine protein kinase [Acidobacteriota bacterium]